MTNPRHVLVVDDNLTNRLLAKALLNRLGWEVTLAESGEMALKVLESTSFALVLLDISMPGLSGDEVCVTLRRRPGGATMRIIAYTAHAFADERELFIAAGFDDILVKPVTVQSMAAALGNLAD